MKLILFAALLSCPILFMLLGLPLLFGRIPPNGAYGFRTARSRSNADYWYALNRLGGLAMVWSGIAAVFAICLLWWFPGLTAGVKAAGGIIVLVVMGAVTVIVPLAFGP